SNYQGMLHPNETGEQFYADMLYRNIRLPRESVGLVSSAAAEAGGDGDGVIEPGETYKVTAVVQTGADVPLANLVGVTSGFGAFGWTAADVVDGVARFGDLAAAVPGAPPVLASTAAPLLLRVPPGA